ncbi:dihydropteroate synthase [Gardnerella vaginalis]|uniref:dihydropteroate synthase n=1 Tax=Gardnerella vaginalis TaxID=2702 RepID=A0A2K1SW23_GARVA|nr:dihydropteroate synthase [Gardnerella vaginalis]PNS43740.1 dihydropteroate synthase [Gardnerella vaginalis]
MNITKERDITGTSLAEKVLLDQVQKEQKLVLNWNDIPSDCMQKVIDFIDHFDTSYEVKESSVQFLLPLIAIKPFINACEKTWNNDSNLLESINSIARENTIIWKAGRFRFDTIDKPIVYAILNITPDSFYDGGRYQTEEQIKKHVEEIINAGADVIEVGGQTTKPGGYVEITPEEEISRVIPTIRYIHDNYPQIAVAVDTYKIPVMKAAIEAGVDIVNDVRAFEDPEKVKLMAESNVGLVTMHSNRDTEYDNLTKVMCEFFTNNLRMLIDGGIDKDRIILDQGIGYAKVADGEQDYAMMRNINQLNRFGRPILVAISRKGFGKKLFNLDKEDRLPVTLVAETAMFMAGGRVIRAHDIAETKQLVDMIDVINRNYWFK